VIPRLTTIDSTARFLADGYAFVGRQARRAGSDVFRTRLMLRPVVCLSGAEAARLFYGSGRFTRSGALPLSVVHLLQDAGSVQTLDGAAHDHRKLVFLATQREEQVARLIDVFGDEWHRAAARWAGMTRVNLYRESVGVLARSATRWAGLGEAPAWLADELSTMVYRAATVGPLNWAARLRRHRAERWARTRIEEIRSGTRAVAADSLAATIANHLDLEGRMLTTDVAAVELLNILRPTVAVARFIVFAALALHRRPQWVARCAAGADDDRLHFAQEVRRYYPFFPVIGGVATDDLSFRGDTIRRGQWVLLDLFGTNRDARSWTEPDRFDPDRFRVWDGDPDTLVPQGGGDVARGHRCPGETATVALVVEAVRLLTTTMTYRVPDQDLRISLRRMPALTKDDFTIEDVRPARPL
jgi:fatty-acid peroxygenase